MNPGLLGDLYGLALKKWRAPIEKLGSLFWKMQTSRRRNFSAKQVGWR